MIVKISLWFLRATAVTSALLFASIGVLAAGGAYFVTFGGLSPSDPIWTGSSVGTLAWNLRTLFICAMVVLIAYAADRWAKNRLASA